MKDPFGKWGQGYGFEPARPLAVGERVYWRLRSLHLTTSEVVDVLSMNISPSHAPPGRCTKTTLQAYHILQLAMR